MEKIKTFIHRFFVPHEENNFRAKSLHTDFLTVYLVIAFLMMIAFKQGSIHNVLGFATDITIEKLAQLTNEQRQKNNLSPLTINSTLSVAAQKKAENMFQENYWSHYSPDGKTPWDFILGAGYKYEYAGENLAKNFLFSNGVVDAWMNSTTHRDNLLKREYTEVGYAIVNGVLNGEQTTLVVQEFGKPLDSSFAPPAVEASETTQNVPAVQPKVSAFKFTFNLNVIFMLFLLLSLALDFYFASKFNIIRIAGKNTAHILFVIFILIGLFMSTIGTII
ncbi:MAG: CAP domain-containing protein [Candidatus Roizmanbacteria bacterium]|nr:CAP domain-containing protein [Candidatus Roizmanbacteria bacterium]MCR4312819.1 CAP domain-containing protein [Candidatus Roizmanbacteria bacterium]